LLKSEKAFVWTQEAGKAFEILREKLCKKPVLQFFDPKLPIQVTTDASNFAIGGVLTQGKVGRDLPTAYVSRVLNGAELNYSTYDKEALGIVYSCTQFRPYLLGRRFTIFTDHRPLCFFAKSTDPTSRVSRWRLKLSCYDFEIVYKAGKLNVVADALSRNPVRLGILQQDEIRPRTRSQAGTLVRPNYRDQIRPRKMDKNSLRWRKKWTSWKIRKKRKSQKRQEK